MKRTEEKIKKMTGLDLRYDGIDHTESLSDYAGSLAEYAENVKDSDILVKSRVFETHLESDPDDIRIESYSNEDGSLICYALIYKTSVSPLFVSGFEA